MDFALRQPPPALVPGFGEPAQACGTGGFAGLNP
ncbi:hypothetical protein BPTFM16_00114 [Altererythrobacter insulae]|nr:hypothetical protein BPTFM16_00114 [Altererythrobacter insulae]